jgi:hypothetical protein
MVRWEKVFSAPGMACFCADAALCCSVLCTSSGMLYTAVCLRNTVVLAATKVFRLPEPCNSTSMYGQQLKTQACLRQAA